MSKHKQQFLAGELNLIEVMQEQLDREKTDKIWVFRRCLTIKQKLFDACLKEKEFDVYFCMSLCVQHVRKVLVREVNKAASIYLEQTGD